ncbi:hypothetical protein IW140_003298 [Coemansia sp. RSA 1813]|nr:hypothetical protein EV178_002918 [Coemansia sp. RSA 1646]KAJ1771707.1 hypothetical protein LPJ74_002134 [Coemansia sp. RSA 1843]KAJ2089657.1 hypothetical protein IW138_003255 [Coemansia sp. RSA 986]KAJ2214148.1 hypothetical protein EV179_003287 [Coemansia sp. RSA 487]KAJ2569206.1 hypothetical protein IW140_003298 [Coemansia sp. RSA 1813]
MSFKIPVVVVGAGVIGLSVAIRLQESELYSVLVVAEHTPTKGMAHGVKPSIEWASPWAGAHWRPWSSNDDHSMQKRELDTYHEMMATAESNLWAGLKKTTGIDLYESMDGEDRLWYVDAVPGARKIPADLLPDGVAYGIEYTTLVIDVPEYLVYLMDLFATIGGTIVKRRIAHIGEAVDVVTKHGKASRVIDPFVVNCTGLGSLSLGGVADKQMYPIRGQTLLVHAPDVKRTITRLGETFGYVIPRGNGKVVIGGTSEKYNRDKRPNSETTETILHRALDLEPALVSKSLALTSKEGKIADLRKRIISVNVGFRPAREGGVRLEHEAIDTKRHGKIQVFHCYGHSGFGFQSSLAYAKDVLDLVNIAARIYEHRRE